MCYQIPLGMPPRILCQPEKNRFSNLGWTFAATNDHQFKKRTAEYSHSCRNRNMTFKSYWLVVWWSRIVVRNRVSNLAASNVRCMN